ncbi:MAG: cyclic lactone autoinducer peptide [Eubacteriales bacterium]|nr:cyclic lactone autoinducer peptide [Eubacteriales bacterium]
MKLIIYFALKTTRLNVNSACFIFAYQPKLAESAKSLRKF